MVHDPDLDAASEDLGESGRNGGASDSWLKWEKFDIRLLC